MGYEARCRARVTDATGAVREADATVLLETDELIVRGDARIKIPRSAIERVAVRGGTLTVTAPQGVIAMTLGDNAAKWMKKIQEPPKKLIDKLDVKPDAKVWLLGVDETTLIEQLEERTSRVMRGSSATACDVVFVGIESDKDLDRITRGAKAMTATGAVWVLHRKGPSGVADTTIFAKAKALGLTYTKVARVSDTHTAEKLVWPVSARGKKSQ